MNITVIIIKFMPTWKLIEIHPCLLFLYKVARKWKLPQYALGDRQRNNQNRVSVTEKKYVKLSHFINTVYAYFMYPFLTCVSKHTKIK